MANQQPISPEAFNKEFRKYGKTMPQRLSLEVFGKVAMEVYRQILMKTPVLTSRARRNWNVSFNAPNPETTEETAGISQTGAPVTASELARAQNVLRNIHWGSYDTVIWVANYLPYIWGLEHGRSMKAPSGIVELAIQSALEVLSSENIVGTLRKEDLES